MKITIHLILIAIVLNSCLEVSNSFSQRAIVKQIKINVKLDHLADTILVDTAGERYRARTYPKNLVMMQNYIAVLNILEIFEYEKLLGIPCEIVNLEINPIQNFDLLEVGKQTVFTGGGIVEDQVVGVDIKRISDSEIEYAYRELINWKENRVITGLAIFDPSVNYILQANDGQSESAFRFFDEENQIEIRISKNLKLNQSKMRITELDKNIESNLLNNK